MRDDFLSGFWPRLAPLVPDWPDGGSVEVVCFESAIGLVILLKRRVVDELYCHSIDLFWIGETDVVEYGRETLSTAVGPQQDVARYHIPKGLVSNIPTPSRDLSCVDPERDWWQTFPPKNLYSFWV